ncbi:hypothetical protein [Spiroplasma endosymbiont of 'Nebria riversi']|uniref:hypothetical protein n=1 Tax=Spiroplasma endosymbiont of 'Nebria riversi' TaxID=2792084 RepID=UPI001C03F7CD|nr:hypothetical protein [Spiroplasma endosymbiont of 'Nebria riversi']
MTNLKNLFLNKKYIVAEITNVILLSIPNSGGGSWVLRKSVYPSIKYANQMVVGIFTENDYEVIKYDANGAQKITTIKGQEIINLYEEVKIKNRQKFFLILSKTLDKIKKIINLIILKGFYVKLLFLL